MVTERSITVTDDRINQGRPTNVPTVYDGREVTEEEAIRRVIQAEGKDPVTGRQLRGYSTIEEAIEDAEARSQELGRTL
jgi:hypothetical protein